MLEAFFRRVRYYVYVLHVGTFIFFTAIFIFSLADTQDSSDGTRLFQLWWSGTAAIVHPPFILAYALRPNLVHSRFMRLASLLIGVIPVIISHSLLRQPDVTDGIMYPIIALVIVMYYDLALEWRFAVVSVSILYALLLAAEHIVRPRYAYLDGFPIMQTELGILLAKCIVSLFSILSLRLFAKKDEARHRLTTEQEIRIAEQEALLAELEGLQAENEARRQEAEQRYEQAQKLQAQLARETERSRLLARYEALMREQYGQSLPAFLRMLLETLHADLGFIAGLAYRLEGCMGCVEATFALPQYVGRTFEGGLMETAISLRAPYLVQLSEESFPALQSTLVALEPHWILYLPLCPDIAGSKPVALLELLFTQKPPTQAIETMNTILPRLGNHLWMQIQSRSQIA